MSVDAYQIESKDARGPKEKMISIICNDRLGGKVRIKCFKRDSILTVKKLIGAHTGTRFQKIRLQKAHVIFKDHVSVDDYEIQDGM